MSDKATLTLENDIVLNPEEARRLLWAKALESDPCWKAGESETASSATLYALGEKTDTKRFLLERADRIIAQSETKAKPGIPWIRPTMVLSLLLALFAFVCGICTEHLGNPGHHLNLLAFPLWGLVLWNIAAYVMLLASKCIPSIGIERNCLMRRGLMTAFRARLKLPKLTNPLTAQFTDDYRRLLQPWFEVSAAKALHGAAIAFALGLVASLVARGVGTAYWACWESTWFADDIETVSWILKHTYGLVPAWGLIPPMPDASVLEAMRVDRLPFLKEGISAAPWIARMLCIVCVTIVLPRMLLFWAATMRAKKLLRNLRIETFDPYIASVIGQGVQSAGLGPIICLLPKQYDEAAKERLSALAHRWGALSGTPLRDVDYEQAPIAIPEFDADTRQQLVLVCLDAKQTPEDDIEGAFIDALRTAYGTRADLSFALLVDTQHFTEHNKAYPERIVQRRGLWKQFAQAHDIPFFTIDASDTCLENVAHALRTWVVDDPCSCARPTSEAE